MLLALATTAKPGATQGCPQNEPRFTIASGTGGAILTSMDQATVPAGGCITLKLIIVPEPGTPFDASLSPNTTFTTNPTQGHFASKNVWCADTTDCNKQFPIYAIWRDPCTNTTLVATVHITVTPCLTPPLKPELFCGLLSDVHATGTCDVPGHVGVCGALVDYSSNIPALTAPFVLLGTPPFTIHCSPAPGSFFPAGSTTVTCFVTDSTPASEGGPLTSNSCTFHVIVSPCAVSSCSLTSVKVCVPEGQCTATVTLPVTITPSCAAGGATIVCVRSDGKPLNDPFGFGVTTVTCTVTDASGHVTHCSATVTVLPAGQSEIKEFVAAINGVPTTGNPDQVTVHVGDCINLGLLLSAPNCAPVNIASTLGTFLTDPARGVFTGNVWCATAAEANHQFPIYGIFFDSCTGTSQTATIHVTVAP